MTDTEKAIARLFRSLPHVDAIRLKVSDLETENVIISGTVHRADLKPGADVSLGMRLRQLGLRFHSDGLHFEPLGSLD